MGGIYRTESAVDRSEAGRLPLSDVEVRRQDRSLSAGRHLFGDDNPADAADVPVGRVSQRQRYMQIDQYGAAGDHGIGLARINRDDGNGSVIGQINSQRVVFVAHPRRCDVYYEDRNAADTHQSRAPEHFCRSLLECGQ
jgi:hypothetical protein